MAIDPHRRLRDCPEDQIGVSIPRPLSARLDALVELASRAGENTSRKELLAALILDASARADDLAASIRSYRVAEAAEVALEGDPPDRYLESRERKPGPRPRRAGE